MYLKAGLPIVIGEGPTKKLRIKTSPPTPVSVASEVEFTYILMAERIYPDEVARRLNSICPEGISVMAVSDAGHLARKNPFGKIEAASYVLNFPWTLSGELPDSISETFRAIIENRLDNEPETDGFAGRILEFSRTEEGYKLMTLQREGDTFHGAKCASYLENKFSLPGYPQFTKTHYYRLKPTMRRLFS